MRARLCVLGLTLAVCSLSLADDEPSPLQEITDLQKNGKLFEKSQYKIVRAAAARSFQIRFEDKIKQGFGEDHSAIMGWFADKTRTDIREELFTAIHEKKDDIAKALEIFKVLWKANPEAVAKYPNLAIAISVVWDNPRAIYDYRGHQVRTKSKLPEGHMARKPLDEFNYHTEHAKAVQGKEPFNRLQVLPWEFLIYVVDHRTPDKERDWAITNYQTKRPMIGKIYETDVKYDMEMLRTQSAVCKLNDHDYTLADIKKYGGVCAMQADFAARVGKSLAVPAAYVGGESQFQGLHAWVMWVEVKSATANNVQFTLESHGRYLGDNYYTGQLIDPQTGDEILDRDMERRLSAAASDRTGKRQAELAMEFYPELAEKNSFDKKARLKFLDGVLRLSPHNEDAWIELARMTKDGDIGKEEKEIIRAYVNKLVFIFQKYPDFSWKIVGDFVSVYNDNREHRNNLFEKLAQMYEKALRPDLACECRIKWAEFQKEDAAAATGAKQTSIWVYTAKGLSESIKKFPDEGRYVPKMLDSVKEVTGKYKAGKDTMASLYVELANKTSAKRGTEVSKFYVKTMTEGMEFLKAEKKTKELDLLKRAVAANGVVID
ncbi:hypothetical protein [Zavarzinella formosa]|uniref:hypothetical protein n=1 Tax=Zavarzinella formosa TaxID=360055 RepID=UPI00031215D8|nr:hypothetical protein [Zavarzinella formosa]